MYLFYSYIFYKYKTLDNFNNLKNAEVALKDWAARNKKVSVDSRKLEKAASLMSNISSKLVKNHAEMNDNSEQVSRFSTTG